MAFFVGLRHFITVLYIYIYEAQKAETVLSAVRYSSLAYKALLSCPDEAQKAETLQSADHFSAFWLRSSVIALGTFFDLMGLAKHASHL